MSIEEYQDFTTVYANGFYNGEEKWKNKIRAKIKELENDTEDYTFHEITTLDIRRTLIYNLKELLEEN